MHVVSGQYLHRVARNASGHAGFSSQGENSRDATARHGVIFWACPYWGVKRSRDDVLS